MLSVLETRPVRCASPRVALDVLAQRVVQRITVPLRDLRATAEGHLRHVGLVHIDALDDVPLTDVALRHLHALIGLPPAYAARIEPGLHVHSINELLAQRLVHVTVIIEADYGVWERRRAVAIAAGARAAVDERVVLQRMDALGIDASVTLHAGKMEAHFDVGRVEVLPEDVLEIAGTIRCDAYGVAHRPLVDAGVDLLRLACTNGAYAQRRLADARIVTHATERKIADFVAREIERIHAFPEAALRTAAAAMARRIPSPEEHAAVAATITRHAGRAAAASALRTVVSWYDHWNAVTGAAHLVTASERKRSLHVEGGKILDRFVGRAA